MNYKQSVTYKFLRAKSELNATLKRLLEINQAKFKAIRGSAPAKDFSEEIKSLNKLVSLQARAVQLAKKESQDAA